MLLVACVPACRYGTGLAMSRNVHRNPASPSEDSWLTGAFQFVTTFSNAKASLPAGCVKANVAKPGLCLYTDRALPFVETPTFLVQQMPGVWVRHPSLVPNRCSRAGPNV
jgi:hypothetical protein